MATTDQITEFKKSGLYRKYLLYEMISENDLTQSWRALNKLSGDICFLKISNPNSELTLEEIRLFLSQSAKIQKRLNSTCINTLQHLSRTKELTAVEYKWMDQSQWCPLTQELFFESFPSKLVDICIILDYLHITSAVHCDIKLGNFLINKKTGDIVLSDLDFLKEIGSDLSAKIIGSSSLISSDVLKNKKVSKKIDIYSLGSSLNKLCDTESFKNLKVDSQKTYKNFITQLAKKDQASSNLVKDLQECNLIGIAQYNEAQKTVFSMQMFSEFCNNKKSLSNGEISFVAFFYGINKTIGLPEEFINDLELYSKTSRSKVFGLIRKIIANAKIKRVQDFWHFNLDDDLYYSLYDSLSWCGYQSQFGNIDELIAGHATDEKYEHHLQEIKEGIVFKPFLLLSERLKNRQDISGRKLPKKLLDLLVKLSNKLGRLNIAATNIKLLLDLYGSDTPENLALIRFYIRLLLATGKRNQAMLEAKKGLLSKHTSNEEYLLLSILYSFLRVAKGDYEDGITSVQEVIGIARDQGFSDAIAAGETVLGIANRMLGNRLEAKQFYESAIDLCKKHNLKESRVSPTLNLSKLLFLMGRYSESIQMVNSALKLMPKREYISRTSLHHNGFLSCVRMGQYSQAENRLQKYLSSLQKCDNDSLLVQYYANKGWLALNSGDFDVAEEALIQARNLIGKDCNPGFSGSIFQHFAELEFYRGNLDELVENYNTAKNIYDTINDHASIAEINLIHCIGQMVILGSKDEGHFWNVMDDLWQKQCFYYFLVGLLYAKISLSKKDNSSRLEKYTGFYEGLSKNSAPLFKACHLLYGPGFDANQDSDSSLKVLKEVLKILESAGQMFWAGLVCTKIGRLYSQSGHASLYRKFLKHAIDIHSLICNEFFVERLSKELQEIEVSESRSFYGNINRFTSLISKINDYDKALKDIIDLAVEETGAERGILMVKSPESGKLVAKDYVNFDREDIADALKISQNITAQAFYDALPITISNATEDSRTMHNKSVIKYNIKSVICLPLIFEDSQFGVLYLDHHTIPALFDDQEIEMVASLSKIISLILGISANYHSAQIMSNEAAQSGGLNQSGSRCIYKSRVMYDLFSQLGVAARSNANILLLGESGTGKDVICRQIHSKSLRSKRPLVKLNCAALPQNLVDSELFGIGKGVATGVDSRQGKFAAADGGTLFLDEIGDMPLDVQAKILRVIEYQEYEQIGSLKTRHVDIRFIYATNKDLKKLIKEGKFREDLFYRINTVTIKVPQLRQRTDDVMALIDHFTSIFAKSIELQPRYSQDCITKFNGYNWPGNVRELKNVIERLCLLYPGKSITPELLPDEISSVSPKKGKSDSPGHESERQKILTMLSENNWNRSKVAKSLNIPLSTFRRKIKDLNIEN